MYQYVMMALLELIMQNQKKMMMAMIKVTGKVSMK